MQFLVAPIILGTYIGKIQVLQRNTEIISNGLGVRSGLCVLLFMMKTLTLILVTFFAAVSCSNDVETLPCPEIIPNPAEVQMLAGTFDVAGADVVLSGSLDSLMLLFL